LPITQEGVREIEQHGVRVIVEYLLPQVLRDLRLKLQVDSRVLLRRQNVPLHSKQRVSPLDGDLVRRAIHLKL
jgi:hypothetical protein